MKEVSSTTWTFQIMIFFILIFACFLTLVLSYSKAYTIKNRLLTIIEKYEGFTPDSIGIVNSFVSEYSYRTKSTCQEDWYGAIDLEGNYEVAKGKTRYYYCFKENKAKNNYIYYDIEVFYKFNLPVIGDVATYRIKGQTKTFIGSNDRIGWEK